MLTASRHSLSCVAALSLLSFSACGGATDSSEESPATLGTSSSAGSSTAQTAGPSSSTVASATGASSQDNGSARTSTGFERSDTSEAKPETDGDGGPESGAVEPPEAIVHLETVTAYDEDGQGLEVPHPAGTRPGDLMLLALHRTDDDLPLYVEGWMRVAECYKGDNDLDCSTEADCTQWHDDDFCQTFDGNGGGSGHDLAQSVFVRVVGADAPTSYTFDLNREGEDEGHPGWAILTALRGADVEDPVRDWGHTGCDDDANSVFPSVVGEAGDMLLLSQSFDDAVPQSWFQAPDGMLEMGYVSHDDEAGFLFGGVLTRSGPSGPMETLGDGGPDCKDALISLSIAPAANR